MSASALPHEAHIAAIAGLDRVGPARLRWLLALGTPAEVWDRIAADGLPRGMPGPARDDGLRSAWARTARTRSPERVWQQCIEAGIGVVTLGSPGYPPALADDPEPPVVLFHRGDPDVVVGPRVAIVGTRRATGYGRRHASSLGRELSEAGVSVVSGLALGIDAAAHRGAVAAGGAPPVAVVGAGLDAPCPHRNRELADQVARRGVIVSEVPPGVAATRWRFPVRNRIIAALSQAVVVVESAGAGGSMHTVRAAMERDRTVLAVPGPIDSTASDGTNHLIADGALVCAGTDDVLTAIGHVPPGVSQGPSTPPVDPRRAPTGDAAEVLDALGWRPTSPEALAREAGVDFRRLSAALLELEAAGWIQRADGWIERVARVPTVPGTAGRRA